jgi:hypothetical protein
MKPRFDRSHSVSQGAFVQCDGALNLKLSVASSSGIKIRRFRSADEGYPDWSTAFGVPESQRVGKDERQPEEVLSVGSGWLSIEANY